MILFVDDEELLLTLAGVVLDGFGQELATATSVADALDIVDENGASSELAVLDLHLPDGTGWDICAGLWEVAPAAKVIMSSGDAGNPEPEGVEPPEGCLSYMGKPYGIDDLSSTVAKVLES